MERILFQQLQGEEALRSFRQLLNNRGLGWRLIERAQYEKYGMQFVHAQVFCVGRRLGYSDASRGENFLSFQLGAAAACNSKRCGHSQILGVSSIKDQLASHPYRKRIAPSFLRSFRMQHLPSKTSPLSSYCIKRPYRGCVNPASADAKTTTLLRSSEENGYER